jgi:hypothetical protein
MVARARRAVKTGLAGDGDEALRLLSRPPLDIIAVLRQGILRDQVPFLQNRSLLRHSNATCEKSWTRGNTAQPLMR